MEYRSLEPSIISGLGEKPLETSSFFTTTSFLYTLFFVVIVIAASSQYIKAGLLRMEASTHGIQESNKVFKRVTLGLVGVLSLWLILATVNKDMLSGDVGLSALNAKNSKGGTSTNTGNTSTKTNTGNTGTNSGTSRSCDSVDAIKASLSSSGGGICAGTTCSVLSGCNYQEYLPYIKSESSRLGVNYKMIVVTLCKESRGKKDASNKNPNGTYDCGLMQINQTGSCSQETLNPNSNITKGIEKMKEKINASSNAKIYPALKTQPETAVFTSYNCCANGTVPNSPSASCKTSDGWPEIPKWACPIDPGEGEFNMCSVKAYACELTACLAQVN